MPPEQCLEDNRDNTKPKDQPYWSSEQLTYLEDNSAMHSYCHDDNDLEEFWPSFFDAFFALWPEGQNIEERKHNIKGWFEAKRTTSTDWIPYIPFELVLASFAAQEGIIKETPTLEKHDKGK
ncbi:hypothetical protein BD769DRAFT_1672264 [Suillus cothurnatus]|nr:hypothetical protein BD769DRAFT_1672264 [Suillus cothurnatus]